MSFYDDASLIMFPSGYKEDKIYSLKPTDGSGDLTFTRASTATRVNADGLIETSPVNLLTYSEQFDNAAWDKFEATITANATNSPSGTLTADKFIPSIVVDSHTVLQSIVGSTQSFSVYAKASEYSTIVLLFTVHNARATFNLSNGTITETDGTVIASVENVGNGWYRCAISTTLATHNQARIYAVNGSTWADRNIAGNGTSGIFIWGAQLNIGATAKPYFPTTDRLNVPRIDYTGGGCGKLLLESQRTNLVTYSEDFSNAAWTKNVTVSANSTISPDGTQNADKILETTSSGQQWAYQILTLTGAQTATIYAKKAERNYVALATGGLDASYFNLDTGVVVSSAAGANASIQSVGNGWYRCSVTTASATAPFFVVWISDNGTRTDYAGDVTKGIYVWAGQNESGSYSTSYIPTLASSVTRLADAASKTGISSLIGQTEGTLFADITIPTMANTGANLVSISLFNSGITNVTVFDIYDTGDLFGVHVNGTAQASIQKTSFTAGRHKVAFGYKANDFVLYVDGVLVGTDTSGTVGAQDSFGLQYGTSQFIGQQYVNQAIVFPTRLTNTQLATLTTL